METKKRVVGTNLKFLTEYSFSVLLDGCLYLHNKFLRDINGIECSFYTRQEKSKQLNQQNRINYVLFYILRYWLNVCKTHLTLKSIGVRGATLPPPLPYFAYLNQIFLMRIWPVNISKFKYVHPGHFVTSF